VGNFFENYRLYVCKNPKMAGHAFCAPLTSSAKKNLEMLRDELEELENSLRILEYVPDFRDYAHKIEELRGKIGGIKEAIAKPLAYASLYEDSKQLLTDIRRIRLVDAETDPVGAAKAYGAAMQSLGKLVGKLPGVAGAVGTLIAEMGKIFHKVVADIVPQTRGTHRRVDEQVMQGGDRSIWEKP
jgi:hypothetical protein